MDAHHFDCCDGWTKKESGETGCSAKNGWPWVVTKQAMRTLSPNFDPVLEWTRLVTVM